MQLDFARVVQENQTLVFSLALRFLRDRATAEELAQEAFLQLYRQFGQIESAAHATSFLRRAICHRCIDESRRRQMRPVPGLDRVPEARTESREPDYMLEERLRQLVARLPARPRMVVLLRYQEDLTPTEIADVLDIPVSTVKSHLHRSLAVLRERLEVREVCS